MPRPTLLAALVACAAAPEVPPQAPDATPTAATAAAETGDRPVAFVVPDESTIPEGPLGDAIRRGRDLANDTRRLAPAFAGNDLRCASCHLGAGTTPDAGPWVGVAAVFPEYRARNARVNTLADRIGDCFERSLDGARPPGDHPVSVDLAAYMTWLSSGVPVGRPVEGRGFRRIPDPPEPDVERGARRYAEVCAACHGADGQGGRSPDGGVAVPPLWGPESFNLGAGMARLDTAAAFVRHNMPLGRGGTLSDQEAYDVAAFFTRQPRPDFARKHEDWPEGGKPRDARY